MVFGMVARVARQHPFKFGAAFSCAKTSFSDWVVQTQVEKRERIDWKRNATFATFGLVYLGGVQYAIYVPLFSRIFPNAASYAAAPLAAKLKDIRGTGNLLAQVGLDMFVHHPLMYFPCFYVLKDLINDGSVQGGLAKYAKNYHEDLPALWKLWIPSTLLNFAFMPMHLRIPWVASTSLIWTCILSAMRGDAEQVELSAEDAMDLAGGGQGKGIELLDFVTGTISEKPSYLYDATKAHILVTATGRDRIGFIADLVGCSEKANVLDAKMYKVGREFCTIMLVEVPPSNRNEYVTRLKRLNSIQVSVQDCQPWFAEGEQPRCKDGVTFNASLRATGLDRPGLIMKVTQLMSECNLDVKSLACNQHWQKTAQHEEVEKLFQITGVVRAFTDVDRDLLNRKMAELEAKEGIRIGLTETAVDPSFSAFGVSSATQSFGGKLRRTVSEMVPAKSS